MITRHLAAALLCMVLGACAPLGDKYPTDQTADVAEVWAGVQPRPYAEFPVPDPPKPTAAAKGKKASGQAATEEETADESTAATGADEMTAGVDETVAVNAAPHASVATASGADATDAAGGAITASAEGNVWKGVAEKKENAFDNNPETKFCVTQKTVWIQYAFPPADLPEITAYSILPCATYPTRDPRDWRVLGSADGEAWETLDERKGQKFPSRTAARVFALKAPAKFAFYRLDITANGGDKALQLAEIQLLTK